MEKKIQMILIRAVGPIYGVCIPLPLLYVITCYYCISTTQLLNTAIFHVWSNAITSVGFTGSHLRMKLFQCNTVGIYCRAPLF